MAKKVGAYDIPFDKDGNQQHFPESYWEGQWGTPDHRKVGPKWEPNAEFEDTLTYVTYERGRSAAYFKFRRSNGTIVCVFMAEMNILIPRMVNGQVTGKFAFVKRGQNYGCTPQD